MSKRKRRLVLGLSSLVVACLLGLVYLGLMGPALGPLDSVRQLACYLPGLPAPASLGAVEWRLRSVQQADGAPLWSPLPSETFSLAFDGGHIRGTSGCNSYSGMIRLNPLNGSFTTCGLFKTLMACLGDDLMERERLFTDALASTHRYERVGPELRLYFARGERLLIFESVP